MFGLHLDYLLFVNIGMWFERFTIISTSLHHGYLPSSWHYYTDMGGNYDFRGYIRLVLTFFCCLLSICQLLRLAIKSIMPGAQPSHHHPR